MKMSEWIVYLYSAAPADGGAVTDQLHRFPGIFLTERTLRTSGQAGQGNGLIHAGGTNFLLCQPSTSRVLLRLTHFTIRGDCFHLWDGMAYLGLREGRGGQI